MYYLCEKIKKITVWTWNFLVSFIFILTFKWITVDNLLKNSPDSPFSRRNPSTIKGGNSDFKSRIINIKRNKHLTNSEISSALNRLFGRNHLKRVKSITIWPNDDESNDWFRLKRQIDSHSPWKSCMCLQWWLIEQITKNLLKLKLIRWTSKIFFLKWTPWQNWCWYAMN